MTVFALSWGLEGAGGRAGCRQGAGWVGCWTRGANPAGKWGSRSWRQPSPAGRAASGGRCSSCRAEGCPGVMLQFWYREFAVNPKLLVRGLRAVPRSSCEVWRVLRVGGRLCRSEPSSPSSCRGSGRGSCLDLPSRSIVLPLPADQPGSQVGVCSCNSFAWQKNNPQENSPAHSAHAGVSTRKLIILPSGSVL